MRLVMGRMIKNWKVVMGSVGLMTFGLTIACGPQYVEPFDPEEQLEIDIELIEEYLADQGYTEYDTIENNIRVVVLEVGDGDAIDYNDIVSLNYVGRYLSGTIFDTSDEAVAIAQDLEHLIDTTFMTEKDDITPVLDDEGKKIVRKINYEEGYLPIYVDGRAYEPYITTHTPGGWFADQTFGSLISGFSPAAHYTLENVNINGRVIAIMPSAAAYGDTRNPALESFRNTVVIFELTPIFKR